MKRKEQKAIALLGKNLIWSIKKGKKLASDDEIIGASVEFCCKLNDFIKLKFRRYLLVISTIDDYRMLYQANQMRAVRKRIRFEIFCYNRELFESLLLQYPLDPPIHSKDKITFLPECGDGNEPQTEFETYILNHATVLFCVYAPEHVSPRLQSIISQATALNKQVVHQSSNPWKKYMEEIQSKNSPFLEFFNR